MLIVTSIAGNDSNNLNQRETKLTFISWKNMIVIKAVIEINKLNRNEYK